MTRIPYSNLGQIGLIKDRSSYDLPVEAWSNVRNARFDRRGAQAVRGDRRVLSEAFVEPRWIYQYPTVREPSWMYADLTSVWIYFNGEHYDISRVGGYNGAANQRWMQAMLNGVAVLNNTIDVPQQWPRFDILQRLEDLENWPAGVRCKFIRAYKNFLIAGDLQEAGQRYPYRVMWSHPAGPGEIPLSWDYANPATDAGITDVAETNDYLIDGLGLGEIFVLYKENSTWGMQFTGVPPDYFRIWRIIDNQGLISRDCALTIPKGHVAVGQDDMYVHSGQRDSEQSVLDYRTRQALFKEINPTFYYNCFLTRNRRDKEVWFCYPESGEEFATAALIWNWTDGGVGHRELPGIPFAYGGYTPVEEGQDDIPWG